MKIEQLDLVEFLENQEINHKKTVIEDSFLVSEYISQFKIGDLIQFKKEYHTNLVNEMSIGRIIEDKGHSFIVDWYAFDIQAHYTKEFINDRQLWDKITTHPAAAANLFLENVETRLESFPETSQPPKPQGYIEDYQVIGRNEKPYQYKRYVYQDTCGKLRHHHIPNRQTEAIAAMWHHGATAEEICHALGKHYLGKDRAQSIS